MVHGPFTGPEPESVKGTPSAQSFFLRLTPGSGYAPFEIVRFDAVSFDVFRAKGPAIYLAQANGLGDTQTRYQFGLKALQFDRRTGLQPECDRVLPSPRPFAWARQTNWPSALNTIAQRQNLRVGLLYRIRPRRAIRLASRKDSCLGLGSSALGRIPQTTCRHLPSIALDLHCATQ